MNYSSIANWLNSGEYQTDIDNVLTNIVRGSELSKSEAETASVFENELYYLLKSRVNHTISLKKEQAVKGIVHSFSDKPTHGRLDAVINDLIIEYKHH